MEGRLEHRLEVGQIVLKGNVGKQIFKVMIQIKNKANGGKKR